ncbi:MAG: hypothetical protein IJC89_02350 [Clostridia bacterium]|nr:hypothetical protein [Clostridia bacterium]
MATFTNQANLTYTGGNVLSNIVTGTIVQDISVTKSALKSTYNQGDNITFIVSILNTGTTDYNDITVTDDLGAYTFGTEDLVPLTYVDETASVFVNGVRQTNVTIAGGPPLTISNITIPAGGNAIVAYTATANEFAPVAVGGTIRNQVTIFATGLSPAVVADETINVTTEPDLSLVKALTPTTVIDGQQITYTFTIVNNSTTVADAEDAIQITDILNPALTELIVTYNGTLWGLNTNYTYAVTTGEFATVPGQITVPAATVTQSNVTGQFIVTPGTATLTITGTI